MAFDREISAITTFCEASDQSQLARRGVAYVQFNRLRSGRFGHTIAEVCLTRYQFSEWLNDKQNNSNLLRATRVTESDPVMLDCLAAYDEAFDGDDDPTDSSTHYHDTSIPPPAWTDGATRTVQIGRLIFYKNVK